MHGGVKIIISGRTCSGKTRILHTIGEALHTSGFNVTATDDIGEIPKFSPQRPGRVDDRLVSISTVLTLNPEDEEQHHRGMTMENETTNYENEPHLRKLAALIDLLRVKFPNATDDQIIATLGTVTESVFRGY